VPDVVLRTIREAVHILPTARIPVDPPHAGEGVRAAAVPHTDLSFVPADIVAEGLGELEDLLVRGGVRDIAVQAGENRLNVLDALVGPISFNPYCFRRSRSRLRRTPPLPADLGVRLEAHILPGRANTELAAKPEVPASPASTLVLARPMELTSSQAADLPEGACLSL
jgi:hypothetical protein